MLAILFVMCTVYNSMQLIEHFERLKGVWYPLLRNSIVGLVILTFLILDIVFRITTRKSQVYSVDEEVK